MIWNTAAVTPLVRRYAALKGITLVSPERVALPSLLGAAERWDAVDWLTDSELGELVVLGERACQPLRLDHNQVIVSPASRIHLWRASDLDDLEYLHEGASERWLDWLDTADPSHFERCCAGCLTNIGGWHERRTDASTNSFEPALAATAAQGFLGAPARMPGGEPERGSS